MNTNTYPRDLRDAECTTEGHPDNLCDQIADATVDALLGQDCQAQCDLVVTQRNALITIGGTISTTEYVGLKAVAQGVLQRVRYTDDSLGITPETCGVLEQLRPTAAEEKRVRPVGDDPTQNANIPASSTCTVRGFASNETPTLMPLPSYIAHMGARILDTARKGGEARYIRPDGSVHVVIEYRDGRPHRLASLVISAQHAPSAPPHTVRHDLLGSVVQPLVDELRRLEIRVDEERIVVNPSPYVVCGAIGYAGGTSGRRTQEDLYGSAIQQTGLTLSGRDPQQIERVGTYALRYAARSIVAAGLADRCALTATYVVGKTELLHVSIDCQGSEKMGLPEIHEAILDLIDLRPGSIVARLHLLRPIYGQLAAGGHVGQQGLGLPWEQDGMMDRACAS